VGNTLQIQAPARVWDLSLKQQGKVLCVLLEGWRLLRWSAEDGKLLSEAAYTGPRLTAGSVAPAGERIAFGTSDSKVQIVDAATLALVQDLRAPPSPREDLAWSDDGALLAGLGRNRRLDLVVWKASSGEQVASYVDPTRTPGEVAFHPSGQQAAVALLDGDVLVLDLGNSKPVRTLSDGRMTAGALSYSADGSMLLAATFDGALLAWSTRDWSVRRLEGVPGAKVLAVASDGARAVIARNSFNPPDLPGLARLIDLRSGKTLSSQTLGLTGPLDVAFSEAKQARLAAAHGTSIVLQTVG